MIRLTTLNGAKNVLIQYSGDEHCIIYEQLDHNTYGYWLVETMDMEDCIAFNEREDLPSQHCGCGQCWDVYSYQLPMAIVHIPKLIMFQLINDGFVNSMSDKEWSVQIALGTVPVYRSYLISGEAA